MKRTICLVFIALMVASIGFAAEKITEKNVASLKGTWEGMCSFGSTTKEDWLNAPVKVEILNDKFPLKGKMTMTTIPDVVIQLMGVGVGTPITLESDEGQLTTKGTVFFVGKERGDFVEISLEGPGKLKLRYNFLRVSGEADLKKK